MSENSIAIIGIGCRFPGAVRGPDAFWTRLSEGADCVSEIPPDRWSIEAYYDPVPGRAGKTNARWGGFVEGIEQFDPAFFAISPREAESMDPQQRLLLEASWEALEDGGQVLAVEGGSPLGVFVGISTNDYSMMQSALYDRSLVDIYTTTGSVLSIAANRVSYCLNLRGPSVAVDTACSSSLVALHLACQSLRAGECRMALAGGVNALLSPLPFISFSRMSMLSPDGRCKAFDAAANGFVRGEGVGVVLLKPLESARADGDSIYAVIRATGVNQDGRTSGITVPSLAAQRALIIETCRQARVTPADIQYVEAHGTGTPVGDPIEAEALGLALGAGRAEDNPCIVGSVKTNIGHLEAGAGVAGLIKLALMLKHRRILPNLHFRNPNPRIDFERLKLRVPTRLELFPHPRKRLLAAINSFGFGGTNAHAILEDAPRSPRRTTRSTDSERAVLLPLSARSKQALCATVQTYQAFINRPGHGPKASVDDIAYSAGVQRMHHRHRLSVAAATRSELNESLDAFLRNESRPGLCVGNPSEDYNPQPVFVFSGQGPQWSGMGRELFAEQSVFREKIAECDRLMTSLGTLSLIEELMRPEESSRLGDTAIAQPAIFALQVAVAALWESWGIRPSAIVGHSVGEAAAAHIAGVLSLQDAVGVIVERGRSMERADGNGRTLATGLTAEQAAQTIAPYRDLISIAALNSPNSVTLSGDRGALEEIAESLERRQIFCRFLQVTHAFHSKHMDPVREGLLTALRPLTLHPPGTPLFSTVRGAEARDQDFGQEYWWQNVRQTVRFAPVIDALIEQGHRVFLEISPHPVLASSISQCLAHRSCQGTVLPSLRRKEKERTTLLGSLGALHVLGCRVDWRGVYPAATVTRLPTYPWQHDHFWSESRESRDVRLMAPVHPFLARRLRAEQPTWQTWIDQQTTPYLQDHRVQDRVVLPAAAYVEMVLGAARTIFGSVSVSIEELDFHKALVLPEGDGQICLQLAYQPQESTFAISSRPPESEAEWVVHSTGTVLARKDLQGSPTVPLDQIRKRCAQELTKDLVYRRFKETGLAFGPAFQGVAAAWRCEGEAIGRVQLPANLENDLPSYIIHPAMLDACLQVFSAALPEDLTGGTLYLPVQIERLRWFANADKPAWSHARLVRQGGRIIVGDIRILAENGEVLVVIEGFQCRALTQRSSDPSSSLHDCLYQSVWQPRPLSLRGFRPPPEDTPRGTADLVRRLVWPTERRQTHSDLLQRWRLVTPEVDTLCRHYILAAFRELGWELHVGQRIQPDGLLDKLGIAPQHRRIAGRFIQFLEEDGVLARAGTDWKVRRTCVPIDSDRLWRKLLARFSLSYPVLALVRHCGRQLASTLRGDIDSVKMFFADESVSLLDHLYQDSFAFQHYNLLMAEAVAAAIQRMGAGRMLRIIEVGAGTGGLTAHVLPRLPADRTEYVFTDISNAFFARAEQKFFDFPFVSYQTFDIEKPPDQQNIDPHSFDIVLASDVLHATRDLRETLRHVQHLLTSHGLLVVLELDRTDRWVDLVFGLTAGWWRFTDTDLRSSAPTLGRGRWIELLIEEGFIGAKAVSPGEGSSDLDQVVLLARAPEVSIAPTMTPTQANGATWVLFADRGGTANELAKRLVGRGDLSVMVYPGEQYRRRDAGSFEIRPDQAVDVRRLLADVSAGGQTALRFMHFWSLDERAGDEINLASLDHAESHSCHSVLDLVQALADHRATETVRLWLVTRGAQPVHPGQKIALRQSPLWGLGRVLINEQQTIRCRMIDLTPDVAETDAQALFEEVLAEDEDEIAIRGPDRYVSRLVRTTYERHLAKPASRRHPQPYRLEIAKPGALDNLAFRSLARSQPGPGEVEIEVKAAGLNFRDVLKALNLHPPGKNEDLPPGDECAGRVLAVGEGVTDLEEGAEVVAIGAGCFGSHLTIPAAVVVRKPARLSFEEAVTLPVAFLTAYYALHHLGQLARGERVLIQVATGGVGLAALQLAQLAGAEIFATAGTVEKRELLHALGVPHVLDSRSLRFADEIRQLTDGRGVNLVLNSLAGEALIQGVSVLSPHGRFLEIGKRDVYQNSRIGLRPLRNNAAMFVIDMAQVIQDKPELVASHLTRIMDWLDRGKLYPLPHRAFPIDQIVSAFRHMSQARHIGKLVVSMSTGGVKPVPEPSRSTLHFSRNATYLITGGLGGFGLAVAEWMARHGARHLVLAGRSGAVTGEARQGVAKLRELGAEVRVWRADVSSRTDVFRVFRQIQRRLPPLRGIIHAAMVIDDGLLTSLNRERFHRVLAPKAHGAWNLHEKSMDLPLDFFVMFSSVSSLIGNPGQGNYAAANMFLDALAHHRRALGLPALTVNWGLLSEVGYAAKARGVQEHFARLGFSAITPAQATEALGLLLQSDAAQLGLVHVNWNKLSNVSALGLRSPRYAELTNEREEPASPDGSGIREIILSARADQRLELLIKYIREQAAQVIRVSADKIDPKRPLTELGLDSLMAVELGLRLEKQLGVPLPPGKFTAGTSVSIVAEAVLQQLTGVTSAQPGKPEVSVAATIVSDGPVGECMVPLRAQGSRPPLFCIHPTAGLVNIYQDLVRVLPADLPVYGIQSRAMCSEAPEYESLEAMAEDYATLIEQRQPRGPIHLFGFSFGGFAALAIAHALERRHRKAALVGLVDTNLEFTDPNSEREINLRNHILNMYDMFARQLRIVREVDPAVLVEQAADLAKAMLSLPVMKRVQLVIDWLTGQNYLKVEIEMAVIRRYVSLYDRHVSLMQEFRPARIHVPIFCWSQQDPRVTQPNLAASWQKLTTATVTAEILDGRHYSLMFPPQVDRIAAQLDAALMDNAEIAQPEQ